MLEVKIMPHKKRTVHCGGVKVVVTKEHGKHHKKKRHHKKKSQNPFSFDGIGKFGF